MRKLALLTSVLAIAILPVAACNVSTTPAPLPSTLDEEPQEIVRNIPVVGQGPQAEKTYVGEVSGSDVLAAIVVQGDKAAVYLCNGNEVGEWIGAQLGSGGVIDVTSKQNNRVQGTVSTETVTGTVDLGNGSPLPFTAARAVDGISGLFRESENTEEGPTLLTGWVILESGRLAGVSSDTLTDAVAEGVTVRVVSADQLLVDTFTEPPADAEPRILGLGKCGKLQRLFRKLNRLAAATTNEDLKSSLLGAAFEVDLEADIQGCGDLEL